MIWILSTKSAATKLRASPFTETPIEGVHSVAYRVGVTPVPNSGEDAAQAPAGTFARGLHRITGFVFSYDGRAAETLFDITDAIDLIIRYSGGSEARKRTLTDVLFVGDADVSFPALHTGLSEVVAVPFRVQIPDGETAAQHVIDEVDA